MATCAPSFGLIAGRGPDEEVDGDDRRPVDREVMGDAGRYRLSFAGAQPDLHRRLGVAHEPDGAVDHPQAPPVTVGHEVMPQEAGWDGVLVEGAGGASEVQPGRELGAVAERAVGVAPEALLAAGVGQHPRADLERRTVADVLAVQARELRHPLAGVVLVEAGDAPQHPGYAVNVLMSARSTTTPNTTASMTMALPGGCSGRSEGGPVIGPA